jgi:hypothetical protein
LYRPSSLVVLGHQQGPADVVTLSKVVEVNVQPLLLHASRPVAHAVRGPASALARGVGHSASNGLLKATVQRRSAASSPKLRNRVNPTVRRTLRGGRMPAEAGLVLSPVGLTQSRRLLPLGAQVIRPCDALSESPKSGRPRQPRRTLQINGKRSRAASHPGEDALRVAAGRRERVLHAEVRACGGTPGCLQGHVDLGRELAARAVWPALAGIDLCTLPPVERRALSRRRGTRVRCTLAALCKSLAGAVRRLALWSRRPHWGLAVLLVA